MNLNHFFLWAERFIQNFGYWGIFFINLIGSASIIFPLPATIFVFIFGGILSPFLVAFSASLGCVIGELVGYGLGRGGKLILDKKYKRQLELGKKWFEKGKGFLMVVIFAATPLPDDVVGILGGIFGYDIKKFIFACFLGKMIMNLVLAFAGFYGINWILNILKIKF